MLLLFAVPQAKATTQTITTTGAGTWTVPANVTSVTVQVWGAGGAGGGNTTTTDGGGGGGGGGYSTSPVAVSGSVSYFVGTGGASVAGGTGNGGGNTNFGAVAANGGAGGAPPVGGAGGIGGVGGAGSYFSGGNGGTGQNAGTGNGAPGGSSAGTAANGNSGPTTWSTNTGTAAPTGGGPGGNGGTSGNNGSAPTASTYGGGGGGSGDKSSSGSTNRTGGTGAGGKIVITYKTNQTITFGTAPTVVVGGTGTVTATGGASGNPVTFTSTTTAVCTATGANGATITGVTVGTCTIAANQAGDATNYNAASQVTQNIAVGQGNQIITFGAAPTIVFGGTGTLSGTGGASGNPVIFTSTTTGVCTVSGTNGSTVTGGSVGTCTIAANQAGNINYSAATQVQQSFAVGKANQTITVTTPAPASAAYNSQFTVAATASSALAVTYSSGSSGICTNSGATFTMSAGTGTCIVQYDQAGNANYNAATRVTSSTTATKANQTITVGAAPPVVVGGTGTLSATGGASGNPVTFTSTTTGVCTVSGTNGSTVTGVSVGTCTIAASQVGNANYNAATQVQQSFAVGMGSQTIAFTSTAPSSATAGGATYTPTAISTSGLAVTITVDATALGLCSISGGVVSFTDAGTCVLDANRAGNSNYNAATQVQQSFTVTSNYPTAVTNAASGVNATGATLNGTVSSNGASTTVTFEYGRTNSYGSTASPAPNSLAANASNVLVAASMTGLTCNTTYHFRVNAQNSVGTTNGLDSSFTTSACSTTTSCAQPTGVGVPSGLTCQCDNFGRTLLNPSTIFGGNWVATTSDATGIVPYIGSSGNLRLTENTNNNAKAATVPGIFPAAGNYVSVEFLQYAYNGTGGDGMAVILSDYAIPAQPGAFGGSLGYAQKSNPGSDCTNTGGCPGFAGGWIGVALDEYGNYSNPTEGRSGGTGFNPQSVGARGSGSGGTGYNWLGGSTTSSIDNAGSGSASRGYRYQVIVDARNDPTSTSVAVNRDTTGTGNSYSSLISIGNVYTEATRLGFTQARVPLNWQVSFTGSTGASTNIHEIRGLRICAQTMYATTAGTLGAFNAIDEVYPAGDANALQGHLYTKLVGTPFKVNVAALNPGRNGILDSYAYDVNQAVTVQLIDDSVGASCSSSAYACSFCPPSSKPVVASQVVTFTSTDHGFVQSGDFTVNTAYTKLIARMSVGSNTACSVDAFAVRPLSIVSVTSSNATNTTTSGTPIFKAGSDNFALTATTTGGYNGVMKLNPNAAVVQAVSPATVPGTLVGAFPAATPGTSASTATGTTFTYSEVGAFNLAGPNFASTPTRIPGVYDDTWTATVDNNSTSTDCVFGTTAAAYSNTKDANGKYGCNFGILADTVAFGRFVPDHFGMSGAVSGAVVTRSDLQTTEGQATPFTYMDEPMKLSLVVTAYNKNEAVTQNYGGSLAKLNTGTTELGTGNNWFNTGCIAGTQCMGLGAKDGSGIGLLSGRLGIVGAGTYVSAGDPSSLWSAGVGTFTANVKLARNATPDGPYKTLVFGGMPQDSDGVTLPGLASTDSHKVNMDATNGNTLASNPDGIYERGLVSLTPTNVRFGRLRLISGQGSELAPFKMQTEVQYWDGTYWRTNTDDSLTSYVPGNFAVSGTTGTAISLVPPVTVINQGFGSISLTKPTSAGPATICMGLLGSSGDTCTGSSSASLSYLLGNWNGSLTYDKDPSATVLFGGANSNSRGNWGFLYRRENF